MVLINLNGVIQLLRSHLGRTGVHQNSNVYKQGDRGSFQYERCHMFLIKKLVHKLLTKVNRILVRFIETPVLLKLVSTKIIL